MAAGAVWLPLESYEGITNSDVSISFGLFVLIVVVTGLLFFIVEGYFISGVLRRRINIKSKSFNTKVTVEFGDLLTKKGWKAVGVNDFFDSVVDDDLVSRNRGFTLISRTLSKRPIMAEEERHAKKKKLLSRV